MSSPRLLTVFATILLAVVAAVSEPMAAPPSSTRAAMSAFADRIDGGGQVLDRIYSDGKGDYVDGVSVVGNKLFTTAGEQDWVLSFSSKNSPRWVWIDFRDRLAGAGPTGTYKERPVINVHDIGSLYVGLTESRPVRINTSQGKLHFDGTGGSTWGANVTRVSTTQWTIDVPTDSVAALSRTVKGVTSYVGSYTMGFNVTVTCVDSSNCLE